MFNVVGHNVDVYTCNKQENQVWIWSSTDATLRSKHNDECLTVVAEIEVWAGPLHDGSQAVVLFNRAHTGSEQITVHWSDIGFLTDQAAAVRDLWSHTDIGIFTGSYTSANIDSHSSMMLKITPSRQST